MDMTRLMALIVVLACVAAPDRAAAYSVFAHEAYVDAVWDSGIGPLLQRRYPGVTSDQLQHARAYAYGGSIIQDLGYYPFGSRFFSNLLHYVRTGDFIESMLRHAQNADEYAFALGALAHYAADTVGHPEAVNRSVPLMYPKLRAKYGDTVTYAQARAQHVIVEFSFDVVQVAAGAYAPDAYHRFIGFEVAEPVLSRAFTEIYGLEMRTVFGNEDLAIATYRHSVSEIVPELTRVAWESRKEQIARVMPGVQAGAFIYRYTPQQFQREFGDKYRHPGFLARFLGFLYRLLPKIGPLRPLSFKTPSPEAERLFVDSFRDARARYAAALNAIGERRLNLANIDLDTGKPSASGEYGLADETYLELLEQHAKRRFADLPRELRANIAAYTARNTHSAATRKERKRAEKMRKLIAAMNEGGQQRPCSPW